MLPSEEIIQLKKRLAYLEKLQQECIHEWGPVEYEPEKKEKIEYEPDYYKGTECFYKEIHTGRYDTTDRWSRTCTKCGTKEYTYDSDVVEVKRNPRFR